MRKRPLQSFVGASILFLLNLVLNIIDARRLLGIKSGLFFANPIPSEHSIPKSEIDIAIEEAIQDAERHGIFGYANTPFILARIKELTNGRSVPANRALIESNVGRATRVAVELAKLRPTPETNE
jgi:pseudouridine-5'-phosphate glycosidase/pseudouridine kinase